MPVSSVTRVLPFGSRHAIHILERNRLIFSRGWIVIFSGFFEPVFFLLGIGFGLGSLIGTVAGPDGTQIPYAVFVAPALLATSAMNGAVYDSTNMFFRLRYEKAYDGMLSTPMNVGDIALGEVDLGAGPRRAVRLRLPRRHVRVRARALAAGACWRCRRRCSSALPRPLPAWRRRHSCARWQDLDLLFVMTLPLFLFSGTFFPIDHLSGAAAHASSSSHRCTAALISSAA